MSITGEGIGDGVDAGGMSVVQVESCPSESYVDVLTPNTCDCNFDIYILRCKLR